MATGQAQTGALVPLSRSSDTNALKMRRDPAATASQNSAAAVPSAPGPAGHNPAAVFRSDSAGAGSTSLRYRAPPPTRRPTEWRSGRAACRAPSAPPGATWCALRWRPARGLSPHATPAPIRHATSRDPQFVESLLHQHALSCTRANENRAIESAASRQPAEQREARSPRPRSERRQHPQHDRRRAICSGQVPNTFDPRVRAGNGSGLHQVERLAGRDRICFIDQADKIDTRPCGERASDGSADLARTDDGHQDMRRERYY